MSIRLRYRFTIARFMPDQVRGEFINIGVIIHVLDTQQLLTRWLPDLGRMRCLSPLITLDQYKNFQEQLSQRYNLDSSYTTLFSPETLIGEPVSKAAPELLDYLYREWSVPFQFSEPVAGFTIDPGAQLDRLYNQLVKPLEDNEETTVPRTSIQKAKQSVERHLRRAELLGPDKLSKSIEIPGKTRVWPFDFGRVNGSITLLQVVPLDQIEPTKKIDSAFIFNAHVDDVRKKGDYPFDTIKAFAVIHQSKYLERMEGLDEARQLIEDNSITTITEEQVPRLVETLRHTIEVKSYFMPLKPN